MNRITRGERLLEKLVSNGALTPQGRDFLVASMDPMHDNQLTSLSGFPDVESSASIVRCVKKALTIRKPNDLTGQFDVVVFTLPFLGLATNVLELITTHGNSVATLTGNNPMNLFGHVLVAYFPTGTDYTISNAHQIDILDIDESYLQDSLRVVGSGLEIVNTTAEIYKQGTCTVARVPQRAPEGVAYAAGTQYMGIGAFQITPLSCYPTEIFPRTIADAMLLAGSRQWEAKDGAYVVEAFCGQDNPPRYPEFSSPLLANDTYISDMFKPVVSGNYSAWVQKSSNVGPPPLTGINKFISPLIPLPMHSSAVLLTGLSEQSSFNLQWNLFIESFPDFGDPAISVLAKPSCVYDSMALHILSECLNTLPVGVQACENPFGEWFSRIISEIADFSAPFLGMIPEVGPAIAGGAVALSKVSKTFHDANYGQKGARKIQGLTKNSYNTAPASMVPPLPPKDADYNKKRAALVRSRQKANLAAKRNNQPSLTKAEKRRLRQALLAGVI